MTDSTSLLTDSITKTPAEDTSGKNEDCIYNERELESNSIKLFVPGETGVGHV
ncbi:hypothetical protein AG4045_006073, partial [Apium graveolens]